MPVSKSKDPRLKLFGRLARAFVALDPAGIGTKAKENIEKDLVRLEATLRVQTRLRDLAHREVAYGDIEYTAETNYLVPLIASTEKELETVRNALALLNGEEIEEVETVATASVASDRKPAEPLTDAAFFSDPNEDVPF